MEIKNIKLFLARLNIILFSLLLISSVHASSDIVLMDFEGGTYGTWKAEGDAFGSAPATGKLLGQQVVTGYVGKGFVNTFLNRDLSTGTLTSPEFLINREYLRARIGGGNDIEKLTLEVFVEGKSVGKMTGNKREYLSPKVINLKHYKGKKGTIVVSDKSSEGFGHINVDDIVLTDVGQMIDITFPTANAIYQRNTKDNSGEISIVGNLNGMPTKKLEASFKGGPFVDIDIDVKTGTFSGVVKASMGQGTLVVRAKENPSAQTKVTPISIGDVFVIAGQSNAAGWSKSVFEPLASIPFAPSLWKSNTGLGWEVLKHPTSRSGKGSPWPLVMSYLSIDQNVPVGIITCAHGGAWIKMWEKRSPKYGHYKHMARAVKLSTNGSMKVRALLWFQGEADCNVSKKYAEISYAGDYDVYSAKLKELAADMHEDFNLETVYVGSIGSVPDHGSSRRSMYEIRRSIQDSWDDPNISPGPITYDILLATDPVHFDSPKEIIPFAKRWAAAINQYTYGTGIGRGPILEKFEMVNANCVRLSFDKKIRISDFEGNVGSKAEGWDFKLKNKQLTDKDIVKTTLGQKELLIYFGVEVDSSLTVSYGIFHDGEGKKVVRGLNDLPLEPLYDLSVNTAIKQ